MRAPADGGETRPPLLVIDDDEQYLASVTRLLRTRHYDVVPCSSATDARRLLASGDFSAVIADYRLVGASGVTLLAEAARVHPTAGRLLMSGDPDVRGLSDAINDARIHGFLQKPAPAHSLIAAIDRAVAQAQSEAEVSPRPVDAPAPRVLTLLPPGDTRDALGAAVRAEGFLLSTASSRAEAEQEVRRVPVDLALIGLDPALDPAATIEALRRASPALLPVLLDAEKADDELGMRCLRAGARGLVHWPAEPRELGATLRHLLARCTEAPTMALHHATQLVLTSPNRESLPASIVDIAARALGADTASLMLPDGADGLYVAHATGPAGERASSEPTALAHSLAGRVALGRRPVLLRGDAADDPRFADLPRWGHGGSSVVFPLWSGERLLGVLNLNRRAAAEPFGLADVERTAILASHVVLALENAQLVRAVVASEKLAAAGELAAGIVHEINNPLSYVLSNLEFVRSTLADLRATVGNGASADETLRQLSDVEDAVTDIDAGGQRMMDIVHDMRLLCRGENGAGSLLDLNDAIRSSVRITQARLRRTAELSCDLAPGLLVHGHPGQLSQVFINLLVNAEQAMADAASPVRRIEVASWRDDARLVVEVTDTGPGLDAALTQRIFEPFFTTKNPGRGTGLGLSISREIIRRHGGDLRVRSRPGAGATFVVTLPVAAEQRELEAGVGA